jgi:hypothetical protein
MIQIIGILAILTKISILFMGSMCHTSNLLTKINHDQIFSWLSNISNFCQE